MHIMYYLSLICLTLTTSNYAMQDQGRLCGTIHALPHGAYITNNYTALKKHQGAYIMHWENNFCGKAKLQQNMGTNQQAITNSTLTTLLDSLGKDVQSAHYNEYGLFVTYYIELIFKQGICHAAYKQKVHEGICSKGERFRGYEHELEQKEISTEIIEHAYQALQLFEKESENFIQLNSRN